MNSFYESIEIPEDPDFPSMMNDNKLLQIEYPALSLNMIQELNESIKDKELILELIKMTFPMKDEIN